MSLAALHVEIDVAVVAVVVVVVVVVVLIPASVLSVVDHLDHSFLFKHYCGGSMRRTQRSYWRKSFRARKNYCLLAQWVVMATTAAGGSNDLLKQLSFIHMYDEEMDRAAESKARNMSD